MAASAVGSTAAAALARYPQHGLLDSRSSVWSNRDVLERLYQSVMAGVPYKAKLKHSARRRPPDCGPLERGAAG